MVREAYGTGESVEEALAQACNELGVEPEKAEYEVIQEPEKKKFGLFGGSPAKVKAFVTVTPVERAVEYIRDVLACMGLTDVEFEVTEDEKTAEINLNGEDIGFIIGRRGETLDSLQYLAGLVANHVDNSYFRITINTGNYREKREVTLSNLGKKLAFKVVKTGKSVNLEPMNPYERRVIHTAVQKVDGAISYSEGEVIDRHVVIAPDPKNPVKPRKTYSNNKRFNSKGSYNNNRNGYSRNSYNSGSSYKQNFERKPYQNKYNKPSDDEMTTPTSTFSQRSPIEKAGLPLFSKIEPKGE